MQGPLIRRAGQNEDGGDRLILHGEVNATGAPRDQHPETPLAGQHDVWDRQPGREYRAPRPLPLP